MRNYYRHTYPTVHHSSFIIHHCPKMPTYEYRCKFCHQISDAFQRMSDAALVKCPHCGKDGLERVVSGGAGVIYKGEGWYVTDYSKKSSGGKEDSSNKVDEKPNVETAGT